MPPIYYFFLFFQFISRLTSVSARDVSIVTNKANYLPITVLSTKANANDQSQLSILQQSGDFCREKLGKSTD